MHLPCSIAHAPGLSQQSQGTVPAFQPLAAQQPSAFKSCHGTDVPTGVLFFPLSQAGHYQDSHPKIYQLSCSRLQTPGAALKFSCAHVAAEGRCKMLFFLSFGGIWDRFHTTGRVICTTIYLPVA